MPLSALSTHTSGLPSLAAAPIGKTLALWFKGTNPYGETLDQLLAQARTVRPGPPRPRYSNLGFQLLGHALAAAAGTPFATLVHDGSPPRSASTSTSPPPRTSCAPPP
nr:hypothetical protein GCM10017745_41140 [Saccharothrix mutabilis subsp. capreolus]